MIMAPKSKKPKPVRGGKIRFSRGAYVGEVGWVNTAIPETPSSIHVIIDGAQDSSDDGSYLACVRKTSVSKWKEAKTHEELAIYEDAKVAYHLSKLAQALAECGVTGTPALLDLVKVAIDTACMAQIDKGKKAKFNGIATQMYKTKGQLLAAMDQLMPE
jgi:hypothetical protein